MCRLTSLYSIALVLLLSVLAVADEPNTLADTQATQQFSPQALDALTAGIALYPDKIVQEALAASINPQAIEAAAALSPGEFQAQSSQFDPSIQYLEANAPELLQQLDQHLSLTTSLGIAAQTQLNDVWASVDRVRAQYQQSTSQDQNDSSDSASASGNEASEESAPTYNSYVNNSTTTTGYAAPAYGAGAFAAGLVAGNAWQDLYRGRPYYPAYNRYPANNRYYHNGNTNINVNTNNVIDDRHPVTGVGGIGGVNGVGGFNAARPADVKAGNNDWLNGIGAGERQGLANNTWGHMDNQARESFTGRDSSPANFNGGNDFSRPEGIGADPLNSKFGNGFNPSQGKLSPSNLNQSHNSFSPSRSPSPSRSFGGAGGPGGGGRGGAGGRGRR